MLFTNKTLKSTVVYKILHTPSYPFLLLMSSLNITWKVCLIGLTQNKAGFSHLVSLKKWLYFFYLILSCNKNDYQLPSRIT